MRKIEYPEDILGFKRKYMKVFNDFKTMQREWENLRRRISVLHNHFPKRLSKIILADYTTLVRYYIIYTTYMQRSPLPQADIDDLRSLFNYTKLQPKIAQFFMDHSFELKITTCFYCETAYINTYDSANDEAINLTQLNKNILSMSIAELKDWLESKSDSRIQRIKTHGTFDSPESFNKEWKKGRGNCSAHKFEDIFPESDKRNHFDLDHALDKGSCPLVALSLMNYVPSCQACNEKLKRSLILGNYITNTPEPHLSPTSPKYDYYGNVSFQYIPNVSTPLDPAYAMYNADHYYLQVNHKNKDYEAITDIFKIRERYRFHKLEGLYWMAMKARYTDTAIGFISSILGIPTATIKEDIFRENYDKARHPCFSKLKKDVLE